MTSPGFIRSAPPRRRGLAMLDVIVGGIMLGIGLTSVMSLTSRALSRQTDGEKRMAASWLCDELLTMVLVEGPVQYPKIYDTSGRFKPPFEDFGFDLDIKDKGLGEPFAVTAVVRWPYGRATGEVTVETLMAVRKNDDPAPPRAPEDQLDRDARYFEDEDNADDEGADDARP